VCDMVQVLSAMCAGLYGRRGARDRAMRAVTATVIPEVVMGLHSTRGRVKIAGCARDDAVRSVVSGEPVLKSGRGSCSAPWTVALEHVEQCRLTLAAALRAHACCGVRQGGAGGGG
jgi:hypothetical protein